MLRGNKLPGVCSGHSGEQGGKQEGRRPGRQVEGALALGARMSEGFPRPLWPPPARTRASSLLLEQKDP